MRFPLYPAVDGALVETNSRFGIDITKPKFPTAEDREIADRFDVSKALEEALAQRELKSRMTEAKEKPVRMEDTYESLYSITGDIKDINTLLVPRMVIRDYYAAKEAAKEPTKKDNT